MKTEQEYIAEVEATFGALNDEQRVAALRWRERSISPRVAVTKLRWALQARERGLPDGLEA